MSYVVVMHIYNEEKHLRQVLDAVLSQSVKPLGLFIVDDQSTDSTPSIIKEYGIPSYRTMTTVTVPYKRRAMAFNVAIQRAKEHYPGVEYMLKVDGDILLDPYYAEKLLPYMKNTRIVACSGVSTKYHKTRGLNKGAVLYRVDRLPPAKHIYAWDLEIQRDITRKGYSWVVNPEVSYTDLRMPTTVKPSMTRILKNRLNNLAARAEGKFRKHNMLHYGRRHPLRGFISRQRHKICPPVMLYESLFTRVKPNPLGCMVCVYDEQDTIVEALKTTMGIVDYYVVVDKNGATIEAIKDSGLEIKAEYYVKPNLTLAESRDYALRKLQSAEWILVHDGDEFYTDQLKHLPRDKPNTYYRTKKNIIYPDRTMPLYQSGYHNFLFHNNGTVNIPHPNDIPRMTGRAIHMDDVMIWNYHHKNKQRKAQTIKYEPIIGVIPDRLEELI